MDGSRMNVNLNHRSNVYAGSEGLQIVPEGTKLPKTRLGKKSLGKFERQLLEKRRELVGDVEHLTSQALAGYNASSAHSHMPMHMADIGSDNWEQEFTLDLVDNERMLIREIDGALSRIRDGTYGVCLATHRPIGQARLSAKPWAKYCIEYARLREKGLVR